MNLEVGVEYKPLDSKLWNQDMTEIIAELPDEPTSPVRTRTVTEIVPGVYGKVRVSFPYGLVVRVDDLHAKAEITAAIATLQQIAGAMEQQE